MRCSRAGAIGNLRNGPNMLLPANRMAKLVYKQSNEVWLERLPNEFSANEEQDGPKALNLLDMDGTTTGIIGGWIVSNVSFMVSKLPGACAPKPEWNAFICQPFFQGFVQLVLENRNTGATDFAGTTSGANPPFIRATFYRFGGSDADSLPVTGQNPRDVVRTR